MRGLKIFLLTAAVFSAVEAYAGNHQEAPQNPSDTYELYLDPLTEAYPGQDDLLLPLWISLSQPAVGVNVTLTFDPSLLDPIIVAPNFFYQSFVVNMDEPGTLVINLLTNLPPPPDVPPIEGDTIFAWIMFHVDSHDPGYDVMTDIVFFEDPYTPYPDNSILLENGGWITPPTLLLTSGQLLIFSPLYGDININGYAYEIGDAVTFMNYFMGLTEFNARQYANSDCNRDGIQATIADLVYLLCIVSGDSIRGGPPPILPESDRIANNYNYEENSPISVDNVLTCEVFVNGQAPLGGAYFVIDYDQYHLEPVAVLLDSLAAPLQMECMVSDGKLLVTVFGWNPSFSRFTSGRLFTVVYRDRSLSGGATPVVSEADFSDNMGSAAVYDYEIRCSRGECSDSSPINREMSISSYPNPFNNAVSISYSISSSGVYDLSVFDILGRRVKILTSGFLNAGENRVIWDGTDEYSRDVASGIYFARLQGEGDIESIKLFMIK